MRLARAGRARNTSIATVALLSAERFGCRFLSAKSRSGRRRRLEPQARHRQAYRWCSPVLFPTRRSPVAAAVSIPAWPRLLSPVCCRWAESRFLRSGSRPAAGAAPMLRWAWRSIQQFAHCVSSQTDLQRTLLCRPSLLRMRPAPAQASIPPKQDSRCPLVRAPPADLHGREWCLKRCGW